MSNKTHWIIYGSYGYTGNLITEIAAKAGKLVILSGRDEIKLKAQSNKSGLPYKKADLSSEAEMDALLADAALVIHCAGPFKHTYKNMLKACIRNKTHYLDITGEIEVFESVKAMDASIKAAGIMAMPGTGFDVVPSDCLAAYLKNLLPDATHLELAFMGIGGSMSHGTAMTMAENIDKGGAIRKDGKIQPVPTAYDVKKIDYGKGPYSSMSIPWGDVSTAHFSTGIPNIIVYTAMPESSITWAKRSNFLAPVLKTSLVKSLVKKYIDSRPAGPDEATRKRAKSALWGKVSNAEGKSIEARLSTVEGYTLTAATAWLIAGKVADGNFKPGYQTPSSVYGSELVLEVPGSTFSS